MFYRPFTILTWRQLMEMFDCGKVFNSVVFLSNFAHIGHHFLPNAVPLREYQKMKGAIDLICTELRRLELPTSLSSATELHSIIYNEAQKQSDSRVPSGESMLFDRLIFARYQKYAEYLVTRLEDELSKKMVMTLPSSKVGYFINPQDTFSETVRGNFSSSEYDMDEACKCFALGRYTASVFHQMRVMEVGLNALGISLGLAVASNWGQAIQDIENEIKSRNNKTHGPTWKTDNEPFYAEAAAHFRMVKNAWRNHTMHTKDKFDEERSRDILNSVVAFMRHLATRLHE